MSQGAPYALFKILTIPVFLYFIWYVLASAGSYQSGDTYQHYLIARYANEYPALFLDHWGKPFYTLLYHLPAQGEYQVAKCFTVCLAIACALFTAHTAQNWHLRYSWMAIPAVLFAPMFYIHINTCMTEVLFACCWMAGYFLLSKGKWNWSAFVISFLPFIRTEGFVIIPFLSIWWIMNKQWKGFFLLGAASVIYTIVGYFHYHDMLWILHQNPYKVTSPYGSGEWLHFVTSNKVIWGIPLSLLFVVSVLFLIVKNAKSPRFNSQWWWLVYIPFVVFLIFHTVAWATGTLASNGELRVMVCTIPLFVLVINRAFSDALPLFKKRVILDAFLILMICVTVITPFQLFGTPLYYTSQQKAVAKACEILRREHKYNRIHFVDSQVPVELGLNPFDKDVMVQWVQDPLDPSNQMDVGDVLFWDAHFAAHEGQVKFETVANDPRFKLLYRVDPDKPFTIFGGKPYYVAVFQFIGNNGQAE